MKDQNPPVIIPVRFFRHSFVRLLVCVVFSGMVLALPCPGQAPPAADPQPRNVSLLRRFLRRFEKPVTPPAPERRIPPLEQLTREQLTARIDNDLEAIARHRAWLLALLERMRRREERSPEAPGNEFRDAWTSFLDTMMALDSLAQYHQNFYRLKGNGRDGSLLALLTASSAEERGVRTLTELTADDAGVEAILDQPLPSLGLPGGTFSRLRGRFQNPGHEARLAALATLAGRIPGAQAQGRRRAAEQDSLLTGSGQQKPRVEMNPTRALALARDEYEPWFSVRPGVATLAEEANRMAAEPLISGAQIARLRGQLDPGDIVLMRRECHLIGGGRPGFWTQAALFAGTPRERADFFNESEVKSWINEQGYDDFAGMLRAASPLVDNLSKVPGTTGEPPQMIEMTDAGIALTTLEHVAETDVLAALRPRLSKREKALALLRAWREVGRPRPDAAALADEASLTEVAVIQRAFAPAEDQRGIGLRLESWLGRPALTANDIARQFEECHGTPEQALEFVVFLDAREALGQSVDAGVEAFLGSWRRPRWRFLAPGTRWEIQATVRTGR